jgi:hypothetical protein
VVRPRKPRIALPPNMNVVRARGKDYYYFHPSRGTTRAGKAIRIFGEPIDADGSLNAAWWDHYRRLAGKNISEARAGTFATLVIAYQASPEWNELAASTQEELGKAPQAHPCDVG